MSKKVTLVNERRYQIKTIHLGWSWSIFLFSPFFSIPLFTRHLYVSGMLLLFIWSIDISLLLLAMDNFGNETIMMISCICLTFIAFSLQYFLALMGNEMSIQHYLDLGWEVCEQSEQEERSDALAQQNNK